MRRAGWRATMFGLVVAGLLGPVLLGAGRAWAAAWLFESAQTLPGTGAPWGRLVLDGGGRLFVPRGDDGLLVWDSRNRRAATVEQSKGATAVILVPELNRAYATLADGAVLAFDAQTLAPIARMPLDAGELVAGFYEPTQRRVHLISAARGDKTVWVTLDAATGEVLGRTEFSARRMDTPATDGKGAIYAPQRDRGLLLQLDAKDLSVQKTWKLGDCAQPVATAWDGAAGRVLLGCRGEKPVFVALSPAAGVVAAVPIGHGVGDLVFDAARHLVATANGGDGSISVIRQDGADAYALVETIATRPMAHGLALDAGASRLLTVAASFTEPAPGADGKPKAPFFHPDSFTVLTFRAAE